MDLQLLITNLTNPTLLFFLLGVIATVLKSDLEIPPTSAKFISLYLLFAIGFKGGQELANSNFSSEIIIAMLFAIVLSSCIPIYSFYLLKRKMTIPDSAAVAAAYGSVSAVTFVAAASFLETQSIKYNGYMVAILALMEAPAIIVSVLLMKKYEQEKSETKIMDIVKHSFTNGSVIMILGSLIIGLIADTKQAEGIKPFTNDIFKGFLAIFLLEMGIVTARRFSAFKKYGLYATLFAICIPLINGTVVAFITSFFVSNVGDRLIFSILAASASYIAVPAAMRIAAPKADPGLYIPMALGITFPLNITIGLPLYFSIIKN